MFITGFFVGALALGVWYRWWVERQARVQVEDDTLASLRRLSS